MTTLTVTLSRHEDGVLRDQITTVQDEDYDENGGCSQELAILFSRVAISWLDFRDWLPRFTEKLCQEITKHQEAERALRL